jgi:hypothetical protein
MRGEGFFTVVRFELVNFSTARSSAQGTDRRARFNLHCHEINFLRREFVLRSERLKLGTENTFLVQ